MANITKIRPKFGHSHVPKVRWKLHVVGPLLTLFWVFRTQRTFCALAHSKVVILMSQPFSQNYLLCCHYFALSALFAHLVRRQFAQLATLWAIHYLYPISVFHTLSAHFLRTYTTFTHITHFTLVCATCGMFILRLFRFFLWSHFGRFVSLRFYSISYVVSHLSVAAINSLQGIISLGR